MKKIIVLIAAMTLLAGSAFAQISGTPHDLSNGNNGSTSTSDEICVFCHTPHNASSAGFAPLWNRTTVLATDFYTGPGSLNATVDLASVNATDAPLCLSCHDGSSLAQALNNPPNANLDAGTSVGITIGTNAILGTDLSNDHPVGFDYSGINTLDAEIETLADATAKGVQFFAGGTDMWCSSCHDVHDNTNGAFLNVDNAGSNLCLACHIK